MNSVSRGIHGARGWGAINLGFWLNKKPNKTPEETEAAKAFQRTFWGALWITLLFAAILFVLTGYVVSGEDLGYQGSYDESRTGRIENGQIRYVKNELYYIKPEAIGLSAEELPEGTRINLYFDGNGSVVAGENADIINQQRELRLIFLVAALGGMIAALLLFALVGRKTFGRPWYQWLRSVKGH